MMPRQSCKAHVTDWATGNTSKHHKDGQNGLMEYRGWGRGFGASHIFVVVFRIGLI